MSLLFEYALNPAFLVGVCCVLVGIYKYVVNTFICPEIYGRHSYKKGSYPVDSFNRRQLDQIRATCNEFPRPYPNGWYKIAESEEVPVGKVLTMSALGREFVVFRGEDGKAGVIDAFCTHLGTHLGHGGVIKGNNIVCPYHLWEFNCEGNNKNIPYCKKDMTGSKRINLKNYVTVESEQLKAIFFWYHIENKPPQWGMHFGLKEIEKWVSEKKMRSIAYHRWDDMLCHIMEPSQNSADDTHFATVHQYLPMPLNLKLLNVKHTIRTMYGHENIGKKPKEFQETHEQANGHRTIEYDEEAKENESDEDDPIKQKRQEELMKELLKRGIELDNENFRWLPRTDLMIREQINDIRFMDMFSMPKFISKYITTHVHMQGPQNILFKVDTPLGKFRAHYAMIPIEPFRLKATMRMYADNSVPWALARLLMWWTRETAEQDLQVWEHKIHIAPRNLVLGDGPFAQYGKWLDYFYTEKSVSWKDIVSGEATMRW